MKSAHREFEVLKGWVFIGCYSEGQAPCQGVSAIPSSCSSFWWWGRGYLTWVVATTFMINPWLVPASRFVNSQGFEWNAISLPARTYFFPISFLASLIFHCLSGPISLLASLISFLARSYFIPCQPDISLLVRSYFFPSQVLCSFLASLIFLCLSVLFLC